jgi:transposase
VEVVRLAKRHTPRVGERLIDELREALAAQTVTVPAEKTAGCVIAEFAQELDRLARRDQLERAIDALSGSHPQGAGRALIPGIGVKIGARTLTEIGDVNRFATAAQPTSYGRAPSHLPVRSSIRSEQKSRRGNQRLKNALWLSAFCSLRNERSSPTTAANEARATSTAPPSSVSPTGAATHPQAAPNGLAYGDYSGRQSPPAAETVEIAA